MLKKVMNESLQRQVIKRMIEEKGALKYRSDPDAVLDSLDPDSDLLSLVG